MRSLAKAVSCLAALILAIGCGSLGAREESASQPEPEQAAEAGVPAGSSGGDVDVCALLPGEEVAAALDARLTHPTEPGSTMNCWYMLAPAGSSTAIGLPYIAWVMPPDINEPPPPDAERLAGLGDEAAIRYDSGEDQYRLTVLLRGRYAIEVIGQERERTRRLAELLVPRLLAR